MKKILLSISLLCLFLVITLNASLPAKAYFGRVGTVEEEEFMENVEKYYDTYQVYQKWTDSYYFDIVIVTGYYKNKLYISGFLWQNDDQYILILDNGTVSREISKSSTYTAFYGCEAKSGRTYVVGKYNLDWSRSSHVAEIDVDYYLGQNFTYESGQGLGGFPGIKFADTWKGYFAIIVFIAFIGTLIGVTIRKVKYSISYNEEFKEVNLYTGIVRKVMNYSPEATIDELRQLRSDGVIGESLYRKLVKTLGFHNYEATYKQTTTV